MTREELEQKLAWALGEIEAVKPAFDLAIKTAQRAELEITRLQEALAAAEARIAETRKKALEEAAAVAEMAPAQTSGDKRRAQDIAAAIRSLFADEAQP